MRGEKTKQKTECSDIWVWDTWSRRKNRGQEATLNCRALEWTPCIGDGMWVLRQDDFMFQSCYETVVIRVVGQTHRKEKCCAKSGIFKLMKSEELY